MLCQTQANRFTMIYPKIESEATAWHPIKGKPSNYHTTCALALAAEVLVEHDHFDEPSALGWSAGQIVNRHLRSDLKLPIVPAVSFDSPGFDEDPERGCGISMASGNDPGGGRSLIAEVLAGMGCDCSGFTRHQLDWRFLECHVEAAFRRHMSLDPTTRSIPEAIQTRLSDFQKAEALGRYANTFAMRGPLSPSSHGCDVLFGSSDCTGTSHLLLLLACVAGLEARSLNTINHSTVEIKINGRWLWFDNIVGSRPPLIASYQEMLVNPREMVCMPPLALRYQSDEIPHYRAPYNYSATWHWRGGGWRPDPNTEGELFQGFGYSLPYDPGTAEVLYPGRRQVFQVPRDARPMLNLAKIGSWLFAAVECEPDDVFRKVFTTSPCDDNPLRGGVARFFASRDLLARNFHVTLDGKTLSPAGERDHLEHCHVLEFDIPGNLINPGSHELLISPKPGCGGRLHFYPDVLENSPPPSLRDGRVVPAKDFFKNRLSFSVHH